MQHEEREYWVGVIESKEGGSDTLVEQHQVYAGPVTVSEIDLMPGTSATEVSVEENRLVVSSSGRGGWIDWSTRQEYRLSPLRLEKEISEEETEIGVPTDRQSRDWLRLLGYEEQIRPDCKDLGAAGYPDDGIYKKRAGLLVPVIGVPDAFAQGGWRDTALGDCALALDSDAAVDDSWELEEPPGGFRIHGEADKADDAAMKVIMNGNTLYLEIQDDIWMTGSRRWIHQDHVELWIGPEERDDCLDMQRSTKARQWAILVGDGAVIAAHGKPTEMPAAEVARTERVTRMKIQLPVTAHDRLSVVYSDSDDGARQELLLATSELIHGVAPTLGRRWLISEDEAVCVAKEQRLEVHHLR